MKDYNKILELHNLTLNDCYSLYKSNIITVINDGVIVNIAHENEH